MSLLNKLRDLLFGKNGYNAKELDQEVQMKRAVTKLKWDKAHMAMEETKQAWQFRTKIEAPKDV